MTTEIRCRPLIARFASKLRDDRTEVYRYDAVRQLSQLWDGSQWVDTAQARRDISPETRITKVSQETADDC